MNKNKLEEWMVIKLELVQWLGAESCYQQGPEIKLFFKEI